MSDNSKRKRRKKSLNQSGNDNERENAGGNSSSIEDDPITRLGFEMYGKVLELKERLAKAKEKKEVPAEVSLLQQTPWVRR